VKAAQLSLADSIIESNELPPDRYQGPDRARLIAMATDAWKKQDPGATVVGARIPSQEWRREEYWRFQTNTWYKVDHSRLQVQLLIKRDDKLAEIRTMNLTKDHLQKDEIEASALYPKTEVPGPSLLLPLSKVK
jgi:hypothetical protein